MLQLVTISGMGSNSGHSGPASSGLRFCNVAARWQEFLFLPVRLPERGKLLRVFFVPGAPTFDANLTEIVRWS